MQSKLSLKIGIVCLLAMILLVPLNMISGKISERSYFREQAQLSIAQSWTAEQSIYGPILVQPYVEIRREKIWDKESERYIEKDKKVVGSIYVIPEELKVNNRLNTEHRLRGIYPVTVYTNEAAVSGSFSNESIIELNQKFEISEFKAPYVAFAISDIRGVSSSPELAWGEKQYPFEAGSGLNLNQGGVHSQVDLLSLKTTAVVEFSFDLNLRGMGALNIAPMGKQTEVTISSPWHHPSFMGRYLPETHQIGDDGFSATWKISGFGSNIEHQSNRCNAGDCQELGGNTFGVSLIEPVDVYLQSERSVKYGILFISLTFIAFFLFEILKRLPIHPVQYTLVGVALSIFYLLLVSLSEHISFGVSYFIAALSCAGLLTFYISYVLKGFTRGLTFGAVIGILYAVLYVIIRSEDNALLMGAGLLFSTLAFVMYLTRDIDWYQVGELVQRKVAPRMDSDSQIEVESEVKDSGGRL